MKIAVWTSVAIALTMCVVTVYAAPIHDAATGDLATVKTLLKADPKLVDLADEYGATPLHFAVLLNQKAVVEFLLASKANVNAKMKDGLTPLDLAASTGDQEIASVLLSSGANLKSLDPNGRTPLWFALTNGHKLLAEMLNGSHVPTDDASKRDRPVYDGKPGTKIGDVCVNPKDGAEMVWVPAGEFLMGSTDEDIATLVKDEPSLGTFGSEVDVERPQRKIYLDGYWMYKHQVTVAQYREFCKATDKEMPKVPTILPDPWGTTGVTVPTEWVWKSDRPMVYVTWQDARDYAKWAGVSVPTEAQWEKAGRGTDGRLYPWGTKRDVLNGGLSTNPFGGYIFDTSPYGCVGMISGAIGSVGIYEWCADWYDPKYYKHAPAKNPTGPAKPVAAESGDRVVRGGSWLALLNCRFHCAARLSEDPAVRWIQRGFRCAMTP